MNTKKLYTEETVNTTSQNTNLIDLPCKCTRSKEIATRKIYKPLYKIDRNNSISYLNNTPFLFEYLDIEHIHKAIKRLVAYNYNTIYNKLVTYYLHNYIFSPEEVPNIHLGYSTEDRSLCLWVVPKTKGAGRVHSFLAFTQQLEELFKTPINIYITTEIPAGKNLEQLQKDLREYAVPIFKQKCIDFEATKSIATIDPKWFSNYHNRVVKVRCNSQTHKKAFPKNKRLSTRLAN